MQRLEEPAAQTIAARLDLLKKERPAIGSKGLFGIYAGLVRAERDYPDGILEALEEAPKAMTWDEAVNWAESTDGRLPTRREQAILFGNVPELFKKEWYWSCEQHASAADYAWVQYFDAGAQTTVPKSDECRARAVRRLLIK